MQTKNIFIRNPIFQTCPSCGSDALRMSHPRTWKERLIDNFTFYKIYRCRQCGWRDYLSTFNPSALSIKVILLYTGFAILLSLIVFSILSKLVH
jgi:hypothetical protein